MSFMLTTPQFKARTKTVTRRLGWSFLKAGEIVMGVEKSQGIKKGEKIVRLGLIKIVSVYRQRLDVIDAADCVLEGFPNMTRTEFVRMFCNHNGCAPEDRVNRIEFEYLD